MTKGERITFEATGDAREPNPGEYVYRPVGDVEVARGQHAHGYAILRRLPPEQVAAERECVEACAALTAQYDPGEAGFSPSFRRALRAARAYNTLLAPKPRYVAEPTSYGARVRDTTKRPEDIGYYPATFVIEDAERHAREWADRLNAEEK